MVFSIRAPLAAEVSYSTLSLDTLVDELTLVASATPGVTGMGWYSAFMADGTPAKFEGGILGMPAPSVPPQMRELVRRGLAALPALVRHLEDRRPTKLVVGGLITEGGFFMFQYFSDEYDPRMRPVALRKPAADPRAKPLERDFSGTYTVKVGDLCYVLIGQIVNRNLTAVRYQPTGGLIVNSPVEAPVLIEEVKRDWNGLDAGQHEASLLGDLESDNPLQSRAALLRLRFYYPAAYRSLQGEALRKRAALEAEEKRGESRN